MRFLRPEFAAWWEVLPLLVACWTIRYGYVRALRRAARVEPRFVTLSRRSGRGHEAIVLAMSLLAAGALVFAAVRPQVLLTQRVPEFEREDLVILLDRSASMRAHDIAPSRFSRAVVEIRRFLEHKPEAIDRVALVGFADASVVLSYLTGDLDSVVFYLDWVEHDPQTLLGTDFGAALKSAMDVARKDDRPTRKLFLLLSDGEDYGAELDKQLADYRSAGLRIHCIGIGSDRNVAIPVLQPGGTEALLRDDTGQIVKTRFAESTLRRIAAMTGGQYMRSSSGDELAEGIARIAGGERRILSWRIRKDYRDLYPASLAVAGAAGAILWLLL
jgi:Ca-activated chloride channel family protein